MTERHTAGFFRLPSNLEHAHGPLTMPTTIKEELYVCCHHASPKYVQYYNAELASNNTPMPYEARLKPFSVLVLVRSTDSFIRLLSKHTNWLSTECIGSANIGYQPKWHDVCIWCEWSSTKYY